ncbi:MAG: stage IV sporulation protein A [Bacteroidales bacterium]|nr:stage IV sporulation protein A [Fournierella massiliensis]MCF2557101.1 stage IV sporulation protein A [Fournierella massiliensis]MCI6740819.1 stage IV sporulation protein A [Bacteroidales bacterium]
MNQNQLYSDIATRTGGDIYIGVVGPVRTGKSTLIKKMMELMVLPRIQNPALKARARDELPQSAGGRTIMTTEPKFIPETAVALELEGGGSFRARLIDCVGYMVEGAVGHEENAKPRMVKSPWFEQEVPFDQAAETGTQKVIREHSTIGLVVTTDGSISDIPRAKYEPAEQRVITELEEIGKPFVILLNSRRPDSADCQALARKMEGEYGRAVLPVNCETMDQPALEKILQSVLYEFEVREIAFEMPRWVTLMEPGHWLREGIYGAAGQFAQGVAVMKDAAREGEPLKCEYLKASRVKNLDFASGRVTVELELGPDIFYKVLGETTGLEICDEASLMPCIISLAKAKKEYDKIRSALEQVEAAGYGIVMPTIDELHLEEPEIVKQGGRYGVRLRASAPSIHLMKATIQTEIQPIVGSEKQSEELVMSLLQDFESDPIRIWESNIFGKSLHELVNEGLQNKLMHMPQSARARLQETLERVINEGCSGLICLIL